MRVLITLSEDSIAPRFDLAVDILIVDLDDEGEARDTRSIRLPRPSPEELCRFTLSERVDTVICGGVEEDYYRYLEGKGVQVLDTVLGSWSEALKRLRAGTLHSGDIV